MRTIQVPSGRWERTLAVPARHHVLCGHPVFTPLFAGSLSNFSAMGRLGGVLQVSDAARRGAGGSYYSSLMPAAAPSLMGPGGGGGMRLPSQAQADAWVGSGVRAPGVLWVAGSSVHSLLIAPRMGGRMRLRASIQGGSWWVRHGGAADLLHFTVRLYRVRDPRGRGAQRVRVVVGGESPGCSGPGQ